VLSRRKKCDLFYFFLTVRLYVRKITRKVNLKKFI